MALKTPICSFDAKIGVLCGRCEERLRSNDLTEDEVHASVTLTKLIQRHPEVDKFSLVTAFKVEGDFVLVLRGSDLQLIRSNKEIRTDIETLFSAIVWLPDGKKLTMVILETKDMSNLQHDIQKIKRIARKIKGIELLVEYKK